MKAPWIQHGCIYEPDGLLIYIFPRYFNENNTRFLLILVHLLIVHIVYHRGDNVVLGGTNQIGNWNTDINKTDSKKIFEHCCKLMPSLKVEQFIQ